MTISTALLSGGFVLASPSRGDESIEPMVESLARRCMEQPVTDTGHWQALKDVPQTATREVRNAVVQVGVHATREAWEAFCCANQPWAEDQFQERVAGEPVNPGVTYKDWPWYRGNVETHKQPGQFSHTYMERFWPRMAVADDIERNMYGPRNDGEGNHGIRYRYGDLNDVLDLLAREPYTRQAYLPIFFPEDTGAHHGERVPCTLGYHFMLREGRLHCFYPIRSCDLLRHFKDDVYMAGRLVQWVIEQTHRKEDEFDGGKGVWHTVKPGDLTMLVPSLHIFDGDMPALRRRYDESG